MNPSLNELAGILQEEIAVAEELDRNLSAQKNALIDWNVDGLLAAIEAREPWLRLLDELEQKRTRLVARASLGKGPLKLRQLIAALPSNAPELPRLRPLQERASHLFTQLQADEQTMHDLMSNILAHIHQAVDALTQPAVARYSESGAPDSQRPSSALLQSRA
jgi:flagellar biosynthesis/type III secretory pathway chaperone